MSMKHSIKILHDRSTRFEIIFAIWLIVSVKYVDEHTNTHIQAHLIDFSFKECFFRALMKCTSD